MPVVLKYRNNRQADLAAMELTRPSKRMGGGWLADLAALGKAIMLCSFCQNKWDHRAYNYEQRDPYPGQRIAIGTCDGCDTKYALCWMYLTKER